MTDLTQTFMYIGFGMWFLCGYAIGTNSENETMKKFIRIITLREDFKYFWMGLLFWIILFSVIAAILIGVCTCSSGQ